MSKDIGQNFFVERVRILNPELYEKLYGKNRIGQRKAEIRTEDVGSSEFCLPDVKEKGLPTCEKKEVVCNGDLRKL